MKIDFVSDVSCPWCAIGLKALEAAIARLGAEVKAEIHFQPFELNPQMPPGGQDISEHLAEKYDATPAQSEATREQTAELRLYSNGRKRCDGTQFIQDDANVVGADRDDADRLRGTPAATSATPTTEPTSRLWSPVRERREARRPSQR